MIIFIVFDPAGGYSRRIAAMAGRNGQSTVLISWKDFDCKIIGRFDPVNDIVFFRTGAPQAVPIARAFEDAGFRVINDSRYIQLSGQKYLANVHARVNCIPIPILNVCIKKDNIELLSLYMKQHGPLVAKPQVSRDMGRFVFLINSEADFAEIAGIPGSHILLQSEVRFDRIVRTIVTRDGMLVDATTYDTKRDHSWKATVCENPLASHYHNVPDELIGLAEKTLQVFGGDVAYIDYFETPTGFVLSEINHSCGLIEHERISGYPIAEEIAKFLVSKATLKTDV